MAAEKERRAGGADHEATPSPGPPRLVEGQDVPHGPGDGEPSEKVGRQGPASQRRVEGTSECESPDDDSNQGRCSEKEYAESSSAH